MMNFIKKVRQRMHSSPYLKNISLVTGGTIVSQFIALISVPILTRIYSPSEFGFFALWVSVVSVLNTFDSACFDVAIPIAESDLETDYLTLISFLVLVFVSVIFGLFFLFYGEKNVFLSGIKKILYWIPLGTLSVGLHQILNYRALKLQNFKKIALSRVFQAASVIFIQILSGFCGFGVHGLVLGYIFGGFVAAFILKNCLFSSFCWIRLGDLFGVAMKYKKFPLFTMWSSLVGSIGMQAPILVLSYFFSTESVGYYSIGMRILGLPMALIGQSVSQVFYPSLSRISNNKIASRDLVEKTVACLLVFSVFVFGFASVNSVLLVNIFLGQNWSKVSLVIMILSPWFVPWFVSSPVSTIALVKGEQKISLFISILESMVRILAVVAGYFLGSYFLALFLLSLTGAIISFCFISWVLGMYESNMANIIEKFGFKFLFLFACILFMFFSRLVYINVGLWLSLLLLMASLFVFGFGVLLFLKGFLGLSSKVFSIFDDRGVR